MLANYTRPIVDARRSKRIHFETVLVGRVHHFHDNAFGSDERVRSFLIQHVTGALFVRHQRPLFRLSRPVADHVPEIRKHSFDEARAIQESLFEKCLVYF